MRPRLTGLDARDQGIADLCAEVAPRGYQVVVPPAAIVTDEVQHHLSARGVDDDGDAPSWVYGSTLPRRLWSRSTKVQVHEPYDPGEAPDWFDREFAQHVRTTTVPGHSCFSRDTLTRALRHLLREYRGVRLKDPNGTNGQGQAVVGSPDAVEAALDRISDDVEGVHGEALSDYLAESGYVVEADLVDVEAWSVTVTRTPDEEYSSFGRLLELEVDTAEEGVIRNYAGTSSVVVRGGPDALNELLEHDVHVQDPVMRSGLFLTPTADIVRVARSHIDGMRSWEGEGIVKTRANVDIVTGNLARRNGRQKPITASLEDSGRVGGASPAELLGIRALQTDSRLPYAVRSSRHSIGPTARVYADHAAGIPDSRVFWDGADHAWNGDHVFIGAF